MTSSNNNNSTHYPSPQYPGILCNPIPCNTRIKAYPVTHTLCITYRPKGIYDPVTYNLG